MLRDERWRDEGVRFIRGYRDRGLSAHNTTLDARFQLAGPSIKLPLAFLQGLVRSGTLVRWPLRKATPSAAGGGGKSVAVCPLHTGCENPARVSRLSQYQGGRGPAWAC